MPASRLLYRGKSKEVWETEDPQQVRLVFTDSATAGNGAKKAEFADKGSINARISAHLMRAVSEAGIPTHLIRSLSPAEQLCWRLEIVPIEVVVRNIAAGSICKRFGIPEGQPFSKPLVELFYKSDPLGDPPMAPVHALAFNWATEGELAQMEAMALQINQLLIGFWSNLGVRLVDFKLEFGRDPTGMLRLADEITPDGARLWDAATGARLDKDVFRQGLADLGDTYRALSARMFKEGSQS
jgi:phosphoribosylaminoimidazole-succinocarboxamide synthase